ncbi:MAG TPA: sulfatase-like hydrolase/transferase [Planctomycetaceae bacterium]
MISLNDWQKFRRRPAWLAACGLATLAIGLVGWRAFVVGRRPNVLLITLDTTRADRLGCYGYAPALTPTLDALAAKGVLFERAYTPAPLTLPSHASMMTGLYPPEHGLLTNGRGRLDENISTLAEIFRDAGYDTAAFIGSFVLHSKFGLERGFRQYDDDMTNTDPTEDGLHRQRDGVWVVDSALAWLTRRRQKPFFCWVHLYDAHAPYLAHLDEFGDRFDDRPYDGGIAYVDLQVARLVKHLQANRLEEQTLIVVAGDHGESLGEHDEREHGLTLYNSVVHVPWIWAGRGVSPAGRRVPQVVSLVDLRPTLLESVGLREPVDTRGRSLSATLTGGDVPARACYSATDDPLLLFDWSPLRCLATAGWKYIRSPEVELYDLVSDPQETNNLAAALPEQVHELENELAALERTMVTRQGAAVLLSPTERRALASLGYLGAEHGPPQQPAASAAALPDVKRMLPLHNKVDAAKRLQIGGDAAKAETLLRELIREAPDYLPAQVKLAAVLAQQQKFVDGREVLEGILQRDPDNSGAYFQLGVLCAAQHRFAEAVDDFRKSLATGPKNAVVVLFGLGHALAELGQFHEAEEAYRQLFEHDPLHVDAHLALANMLANQADRAADAEEHYREVLKYTPSSTQAHGNLAILLAGQSRLAEAGAHFARALELSPNSAELRYQYGTLLLLEGRLDEAIRELEEALRLDPRHPRARTRLQSARDARARGRLGSK